MKLKIKFDSKDGSFTGSNGDRVVYFYTKALVIDGNGEIPNGVSLEFGSKSQYKKDQEIVAVIEKSESQKGGFRYKEIQ